MKFALLYHYDPAVVTPGEDEVADWMAFDEQARAASIVVHEAGFFPEAQTVEGEGPRDGSVRADGPQLAGYYVLDVADASEAASWAARLPTSRYGQVEIRRVVEFDG